MQNRNYDWNTADFVTICTKNRIHYFGRVVNVEMECSEAVVIAETLWCEIIQHAKNAGLGEFVVMPNHVYGIVILDGNGGGGDETKKP